MEFCKQDFLRRYCQPRTRSHMSAFAAADLGTVVDIALGYSNLYAAGCLENGSPRRRSLPALYLLIAHVSYRCQADRFP